MESPSLDLPKTTGNKRKELTDHSWTGCRTTGHVAQWLQSRNSNPKTPGFDPLAGQGEGEGEGQGQGQGQGEGEGEGEGQGQGQGEEQFFCPSESILVQNKSERQLLGAKTGVTWWLSW